MDFSNFNSEQELFALAVLAYLDEKERPDGEVGDACDELVKNDLEVITVVKDILTNLEIRLAEKWFTEVLFAGCKRIATKEAVAYYAEQKNLTEREFNLIYQTLPSLGGLLIGLFAPFDEQIQANLRKLTYTEGQKRKPLSYVVETLIAKDSKKPKVGEVRTFLYENYQQATVIKTAHGDIMVIQCSRAATGENFTAQLKITGNDGVIREQRLTNAAIKSVLQRLP